MPEPGAFEEDYSRPEMLTSGGEWVPSIPLPFYEGRKSRCQCGRKFKVEQDYRDHWVQEHSGR